MSTQEKGAEDSPALSLASAAAAVAPSSMIQLGLSTALGMHQMSMQEELGGRYPAAALS